MRPFCQFSSLNGGKLSNMCNTLASSEDKFVNSQVLGSYINSDSSSLFSKSVLLVAKLETILSGKEAGDLPSELATKNVDKKNGASRSDDQRGKFRRRKRIGFSKSLSELEFKELKAFMDLGFVFSDEGRDSSLVTIIPGLQRFGTKVGGNEEHDVGDQKTSVDESTISRPYLSEAWDVLDDHQMKPPKLKQENPLMNWKTTSTGGTDLEIKNRLRFWAYTVASTVR